MTTLDPRTLKPCPFCGGENLEFYYADIEGWIAHVRCIECDDMIGPMSECKYDDKFEAAEDASTKWNRRASPQPQAGEPVAWRVLSEAGDEGSMPVHFARTRQDADHVVDNLLKYRKGCTSAFVEPLYASPQPALAVKGLEEGLGILNSLIDNIKRHGNYSPETTCDFIDQACGSVRSAMSELSANEGRKNG